MTVPSQLLSRDLAFRLQSTSFILMNASVEGSEAAILDRVLRPEARDWLRPAAEAILSLGFDEQDHRRLSDLLTKAKACTLALDEAATLENYRRVGRLRELMKSRARRSLQPNAAA